MAKIMLVEDDNNLREIYEARLQAEGYTLVAAKDGEEALGMAKTEMPDLIISDVMMPKVSGFEMLDILRNTEGLKDVKVIMLTALGQSDDQQRADQLGADRYLVKSQVTLEDIVKMAHELLNDNPQPAPVANPPQTVESVMTPPVAAPVAVEPPVDNVLVTQTSAQEESDVNAEIANFVSTPTPVTTPVESPSPEQVIDANDGQIMSDAIDSLVANTNPVAAPEIATEPAVATAEPSEPTSTVANNNIQQIAHKKMLNPVETTPKQDLNALWALEEAKTASEVPVAPASEPVATYQPQVIIPTASETGLPPAETVTAAEPASNTFDSADPNHIAL